jgi:hypothetical protein
MTGKPAYQPADLFAAVVDDTIPHDASLRPTKALALSKRELATVAPPDSARLRADGHFEMIWRYTR